MFRSYIDPEVWYDCIDTTDAAEYHDCVGTTDSEAFYDIDFNSPDGDCSLAIHYGSEDFPNCPRDSVGTSVDLEKHVKVDDDSNIPYEPPKCDHRGIEMYFKVWTAASIQMFVLNLLNTKWGLLIKESWWTVLLSIAFILIQAVLQWSVLEIPLMSFATMLVEPLPDTIGDGTHLTVIINYNLLASDKAEVDAALENAFDAYAGNLSPSVVAVLVSATGEKELKDYEIEVRDIIRKKISKMVMEEGAAWAEGTVIDEGRASRCFEAYRNPLTKDIPKTFVETTLPALADKYARDFMVVQRVTRVLRKCGQYQDLMLLSEGNNQAWTYTDKKYYNEAARKPGEYLFHPSNDVDTIQGRKIDYTLVLDGDTGVVKDSLHRLMNVAAANPNRAILQPSIKMIARPENSLFTHIDAMRQEINEPISAALTTLLGRSGFYGKGLIQNKLYIRAMLGSPQKPIEKVPIDVLSHDTFEAAALSPLYVKSVHLLEEPCGNYVTWDIREGRWNRGELVLSHYFFPHSMGAFFTWLMTKIRDKPPVELHLRTETHLDEAGAYIAHSALRQMILKPMLLMYVLCRSGIKVYTYYPFAPLFIVMFGVLVVPKFALMRRENAHLVLAESLCSIIQYSPEPIMGSLRTFKAIKAHVTGVGGWVPQFKVEQDFVIKPAVIATFQYQWKMVLCMAVPLVLLEILKPEDFMAKLLFITTIILPLYTTLTALSYESWERQVNLASKWTTVWVVRPVATAKRAAVAILQSIGPRVDDLGRSVSLQKDEVLKTLAMEKYQPPPLQQNPRLVRSPAA